MANLLKYSAVNWAEDTPIAGERLASNALYTGEQVGAVMQDAKAGGSVAHSVEEATLHFGTIMHDAADTNFPKVANT
jgi:hypothetical protein